MTVWDVFESRCAVVLWTGPFIKMTLNVSVGFLVDSKECIEQYADSFTKSVTKVLHRAEYILKLGDLCSSIAPADGSIAVAIGVRNIQLVRMDGTVQRLFYTLLIAFKCRCYDALQVNN